MALERITGEVYVILGGVNLGLLFGPEGALAIDAGQDKDTAKRLAAQAAEVDITIKDLLITHAHADHFGGAGYLSNRTGCRIHTSRFEKAIIENPILEPLYLFSGAKPVRDLTGKFYLGEAAGVTSTLEPGRVTLAGIEVDLVSLPGHSPGQVGLMYDGVLFAADSIFPKGVLEKYRIPFFTDIDAARDSFTKILALQPEVIVPGHGPICRGAAISELIAINAAALEELRQRTWELTAQPRSTAEILGAMMDSLGLQLNAVGQYCLAFTTIQAACSSLVEAGEAKADYSDNMLRWRRS